MSEPELVFREQVPLTDKDISELEQLYQATRGPFDEYETPDCIEAFTEWNDAITDHWPRLIAELKALRRK